MKATFITDEASQAPEEFIRLAQSFGLRAVELRSVRDKHVSSLDGAEMDDLRRRLADAGLAVCCIDTSVFKCDIDGSLDPQLEKLRRALDAAARLQAKLLRIFSFWRRPERDALEPRVVDALGRALDIARPAGVRLAIENGKRTMHASGAELAALLRDLADEGWGVVWDPANSIFGGVDPEPLENGYPAVRGRIAHVHLKDPAVYRDGRRRYVELGSGALRLERQLSLLRADGYAGYLSVETHFRPDRELGEAELDVPGGEAFSANGYGATALCLTRVCELLQRRGAAGGA